MLPYRKKYTGIAILKKDSIQLLQIVEHQKPWSGFLSSFKSDRIAGRPG
jgi:hypothetical protein